MTTTAICSPAGGDYAAAIAKYRKAIEFDPEMDAARLHLGMAAALSGKLPLALETYEQLLARHPASVEVRYRIAWILATATNDSLRDGQRALRMAEKLIDEGHQDDPQVLDALAAAHAELEEFDQAQAVAKDALNKAKQLSNEALAAEIQSRIALYEMEQPARDDGTRGSPDK